VPNLCQRNARHSNDLHVLLQVEALGKRKKIFGSIKTGVFGGNQTMTNRAEGARRPESTQPKAGIAGC